MVLLCGWLSRAVLAGYASPVIPGRAILMLNSRVTTVPLLVADVKQPRLSSRSLTFRISASRRVSSMPRGSFLSPTETTRARIRISN